MRFLRLTRAAAIGLVFLLMLSACVPTNVQRSPAEIAAAQNAATLARQGHLEQAAQAYQDLADSASSGLADRYRLLAAEAWWQDGQIQRAAPTIARIRRQRLSGDEPLRLDLLQAELALLQNNAPLALQLTTQAGVSVPKALQLRLLELRARALHGTGDNWGAARTRTQMDGLLHGFDKAQNRKQTLALLTKLGVDPLTRRAAAMQPGDPMLPWVDQALGALGVSVARPQAQLQQAVGTLLPGAGANVREGYKVPAHLALLLPGDGDFAAASVSVREGFFAAYFDASHNHAPRPQVRVYNSHGTPAGAVAGYQQAVSDGAQLVVGPLTRTEVAAVFGQPKLPVPLLALNHPDSKQLPAGDVSEFGLLPETEGAQAADHMVERGLKDAFVITSSDDFAQRAGSAFKAEMIARGGQIDGMLTVTTFNHAISGLGLANAPADAGIFISMRPNEARQLVPQLRIANIKLPVFATSHIYAGVDDTAANQDLDGVEFCDAPWLFNAQSGLPNHDDISALLPAARGSAGRLFAFGMDAWNLVPYLDWLRAHPGSYLPGATGQLTADTFGHIRRVLIWATFQGGLARPLGGSLQMDAVPADAAPAEGSSAPAPASSAPTGHGAPG